MRVYTIQTKQGLHLNKKAFSASKSCVKASKHAVAQGGQSVKTEKMSNFAKTNCVCANGNTYIPHRSCHDILHHLCRTHTVLQAASHPVSDRGGYHHGHVGSVVCQGLSNMLAGHVP